MRLKGVGLPNNIVIGWSVDQDLRPVYWLTPHVAVGQQSPSHLVTIGPDRLAAHTAIIAQSGSGKSFLLGRLLEEALLKTRCELTVIDPNSDFRRLGEVHWNDKRAKYDPAQNAGGIDSGWLVDGAKEEFENRWTSLVSPQVLAYVSPSRHGTTPDGTTALKLSWSDAGPAAFRSDGLTPMETDVLDRLHRYYLAFAAENKQAGRTDRDGVNAAMQLLNDYRRDPARVIQTHGVAGCKTLCRLLDELKHAEEGSLTFYSSKVNHLADQGLLADTGTDGVEPRIRASILDLPSFGVESRELVVHATLARLWRRKQEEWETAIRESVSADRAGKEWTDRRVPHFVVIDEAHNVIPRDPLTSVQREIGDMLVRIAAEGRKYGLFLLIVSQRPDKVNPRALSECENKLLLRIGSRSVLQNCRELLGLEDVEQGVLDQTLRFFQGCGLLIGKWSPHPRVFRCVARRTKEGGSSLNESVWATPPASEPAGAAKSRAPKS